LGGRRAEDGGPGHGAPEEPPTVHDRLLERSKMVCPTAEITRPEAPCQPEMVPRILNKTGPRRRQK
jgi:hypothetical protein